MAAATNSEWAGGLGSDAALFGRRIEFHVSRRPFSGFGNKSSSGFKLVTMNPNPEPQETGSGKKREKSSSHVSESGLDLDPELNSKITFRRIGAGLRNLGNTCFLNSVLQCLTYTEPLAAYLQTGKHQISCRTSGFCALCAIQKHVSCALQSNGRILEPKDLVSNLRCISRSFRNARQEDAHEFLVNLLESMHKCCLPSGVPSESHVAYDKSLVHNIFGGRLLSQVKCTQCSYCSVKFDPFLDISLDIEKADSLVKALGHFTAKEKLEQYECEQCKQKVKALKQLTFHKAPRVLAVHLKRFSSHAPGRKIDKKIAFGPTLDLKPFVTGPCDEGLNYTLYGVLVHAGWNTHSGHYYCFVRTSSGMWYALDDNRVYQASERNVLEQEAYMLFYVGDTKNLVSKKMVPKENNMAIGNAAYSKLNLGLKEEIQNGAIEKKTDGNSPVSVDNNSWAPQSEQSSVLPSPSKAHPTENINSVDTLSLCVVEEDGNASGFKLLPDCIVPQDLLHKKETRDDFVLRPPICSVVPMESVAGASKDVNNVKQIGIEESQVGGSSGQTSDSTIEENQENGQPESTTQHSSRVETKKKRPELKVKRQLLKHAWTRSNIIFGMGLYMRKKKLKQRKDQKKKKHASATAKLAPLDSNQKNKSKNLNISGEGGVTSDVIDHEFSKRVVVDASAEKQPQKIERVVDPQMDVMSMLTSGSLETTVARWDGIEVSRTEKLKKRPTVQIGYIGDDWDAEYDGGKRKKLRGSKINLFGGPNLFQEIAMKRSKAKQPFR